MIKVGKCFIVIITISLLSFVSACSEIDHDPNDVKTEGNWTNVDAYYNQIELFWDEGYFLHESIIIEIPDNWGGWGKKSDFDNLDKHDLIYQYKKRSIEYYSGEIETETLLRDLDHEHPTESTLNFHVSMIGINIDAKVLIQDEYANDYYFKYDFNPDFTNYCYFRIPKNDVNQLKQGSFNEIRVDLIILTHIDGSKSFKLRNDDGITEVGYYGNIGIVFNPDLVE